MTTHSPFLSFGNPGSAPARSRPPSRLRGCAGIGILCLCLGLAASGNWSCSDSTSPRKDTEPPGRVVDIHVESVSADTARVVWTASGDDGDGGTASTVDLRYSRDVITGAAWDTATRVSPAPVPRPAGAAMSWTVPGLALQEQYYFALKTCDDAGNWSELSNGCSCLTALPQSSPANCLANLRSAYLARNSTEYLKLFASDFSFVFCPTDVRDPVDPTPASWGLAEERDSHERMFSSGRLERIQLFLVQEPAEESGDEFAGTWKVEVPRINLTLDTRNVNNAPWIYRVVDGHATLYFKEYPGELASDGRPLLRIWRWEDEPRPGIAPLPPRGEWTTWGRIKAHHW